MKISIEAVKELRNRTNVGIADCNKALLEVGGDMEKAIEFLKQRGAAIAEKKKGEAVTEGVIEAYIHHTKRIGALVELNCETDFVARTAEFKEQELQPEAETDPQAACLLSQLSIKEPTKTVQEIIAETIAKVGENIKVGRFARFELGVDH